MFGFVFVNGPRRTFDQSERTRLVISIGFKRVPIEEHDTEMQERAKEMQNHPAHARSKRFFFNSRPPENGLKEDSTLL